MYLYYRYKQNKSLPFELPYGITIKKSAIKVDLTGAKEMGVSIKMFWYLYIMTTIYNGFNRNLVEYKILKDNREICKVVVNSWCPIYKFMPKNGVHVGFARTLPEERGKGYYTLLLKYIQCDMSGFDLYMIVHESNVASIKGVEKAGFKPFGIGDKINRNWTLRKVL